MSFSSNKWNSAHFKERSFIHHIISWDSQDAITKARNLLTEKFLITFFPPQLYILVHRSLRFVFQTISLLNIYLHNLQNSAQSADGLHCKFSLHMQDPPAPTPLNLLFHTPHINSA